MNHVSNDSNTANLLSQWGNGQQVHSIVHFFWISGEGLEKSRLGLLRNLLYQTLCQRQDLIEECMPGPLEYFRGYAKPQKIRRLDELHQTLSIVLKRASVSAKYCLFIDGLDECVGDKQDGDHMDLISTLQQLMSPNVKICVSSRPWNVFESTFRDTPQLKLHAINRYDIEKLVRNRLMAGRLSSGAMHSIRAVGSLTTKVVDKAQGVFQWAALVAEILRDSMVDGTSMEGMEGLLEHTPPELDDLYLQMLNKVKLWHRKYAAITFLLLLSHTASDSLPVLYSVYINDETNQTELAWEETGETWSVERYQDKTKIGQRLAKSWCGDLVDIVHEHDQWRFRYSHGSEIEWPHRTVFDFFQTESVSSMITLWAGERFIPELMKLEMYARMASRTPVLVEHWKEDRNDFVQSVVECLAWLGEQNEQTLRVKLPPLLEGVDSIGQSLFVANSEEPHWTLQGRCDDHEYYLVTTDQFTHASIDKLSSKALFVSWQMSQGICFWPPNPQIYTLEPEDAHSLWLESFLFGLWCKYRPGNFPPSKAIALYLLNRGIDVNKPIPRGGDCDYSIWQRFMILLHDYSDWIDGIESDETEILDIMKVMLDAGAQPSAPLRRHHLYSFLEDEPSGNDEWIPANKAFDLQEDLSFFDHYSEDEEKFVRELFVKVHPLLQEAISARKELPSATASDAEASSSSLVSPQASTMPAHPSTQSAKESPLSKKRDADDILLHKPVEPPGPLKLFHRLKRHYARRRGSER